MHNIISCKKSCHACPSQWDAMTDDKRIVYIRYRYGNLWIYIGPPGHEGEVFLEDIHAIMTRGYTHKMQLSTDDYDGVLDTRDLLVITKKIFNWNIPEDVLKGMEDYENAMDASQ